MYFGKAKSCENFCDNFRSYKKAGNIFGCRGFVVSLVKRLLQPKGPPSIEKF